MSTELLEFSIASEVSSKIADGIRAGLDPHQTMGIYFSALGASYSILYPDTSVTDLMAFAADGSKYGFLEANAMDFEPRPL